MMGQIVAALSLLSIGNNCCVAESADLEAPRLLVTAAKLEARRGMISQILIAITLPWLLPVAITRCGIGGGAACCCVGVWACC